MINEPESTATFDPATKKLTATFNPYRVTGGLEELVTLTLAPYTESGDPETNTTAPAVAAPELGVIALSGIYFDDIDHILPRVCEAAAEDEALRGTFVLNTAASSQDLYPDVLAARAPELGPWDETSMRGLATLVTSAYFESVHTNPSMKTLRQQS